MRLPPGFESHPPLDSLSHRACWPPDEAPVLRNHHLAATQVTDLLQIDFSRVTSPLLTRPAVATLGHALRLAGAELLELDHRELGVLHGPVGGGGTTGLLLFDDMAGGAGHVAELSTVGRAWLEGAAKVLWRHVRHDRACETACLECVLTASSQADMEAGFLHRRAAANLLGLLLAGQPSGSAPTPVGPQLPPGQEGRTPEERRQRFRERHQAGRH
jgi:hypothetical protein